MPPTLYAPERGTLGETLSSMSAPFTTLASSTAEAIIVPDVTIPANYLGYLGATLRGRIRYVCSNIVTTPGTLTLRIRIGTTTLSATAVVASRAIGLDTTAQTNAAGTMDFEIVTNAAGASGTALITGEVRQFNQLASTAANLLPIFMPVTGNAAQTVNTTVANILSVSGQFSVSGATTNLTAQEYILESIA